MASSSSMRRSAERPVEMGAKDHFHVSETSDQMKRDSNSDFDQQPNGLGNTAQDALDMQRLGKKQQFKRNFSLWSSIGFVAIYMATWEFVLVSLSIGFSNGGYAGLFWCFITTTAAYSTIVASLAEMASMAPTSGGQYHWVSEFSPPSYQKVLSYAAGWMTTLGWIASTASSVYVIAWQVQACLNVTRPDYEFTSWQIMLIMWAIIVVTILFNTYGTPFFPQLETMSLIGHVVGFFVVMIPLWVLCEKNSAHDVFLNFQDQSGWNNMGAVRKAMGKRGVSVHAYLTSQIYVLWCCFGSDSVVHLSEEVENASVVVPRAMWWSYVGNLVFGFIMLITMLFCIGPVGPVIEAYWPFIVLFNRTGSEGLNLFFNILLWILIYLGNITSLATVARETWAFARDKGLPFSGTIGKMNERWNIPFNSVYITSAIMVVLSFIQLGSDTAFNILVSLSTLGLMSTYMLSIGCVLLKRLRNEALPHARWSLGRWGIWINGFAFLYATFIMIICCFPLALPVGVADANWAPLIWFGVIVLATVMYLVQGRKNYTPPVDFVEGRKNAGVGLQHAP